MKELNLSTNFRLVGVSGQRRPFGNQRMILRSRTWKTGRDEQTIFFTSHTTIILPFLRISNKEIEYFRSQSKMKISKTIDWTADWKFH